MNAKVISGLSDAEYFALPGVNQSRLKVLAKSPSHFRASVESEARELVIGDAVHLAALRPSLFKTSYIQAGTCSAKKADGITCGVTGKLLSPEGQWRCGTHGKGAYPAPQRILSLEEFATVSACAKSITSRFEELCIPKSSLIEQVITWDDDVTGIACKAKIDLIEPETGIVIDIKTCADASARGFTDAVGRYQYHLQAAWYWWAAREAFGIDCSVRFCCVEKEPPFGCPVYTLNAAAMSAGSDLARSYLDILAVCKSEEAWPSYPDGEIALPAWAAKQ